MAPEEGSEVTGWREEQAGAWGRADAGCGARRAS